MQSFDIHSVSRDTVLTMVKEEQVIRYSKGIQDAYTQQYHASIKNPLYELVNIEREIQKFILRKFGYSDDDASLTSYWKIPSMYWDDEEVKNSIFYMKLNIFQYPKVSVGDTMVDVSLIDYATDQTCSLRSLSMTNKPLVILAGSMT